MAELPRVNRRVSLTAPRSGVTSTGLEATARTAQALTGAATEIGATFYKVAADSARRKGEERANAFTFQRDPETGNLAAPPLPVSEGRLIPSIHDQAYTEAVLDRYQAQIVLDAGKYANQLASEVHRSPDAARLFSEQFQQYFDTTVNKSVPEQIRGVVADELSGIGVQYGNALINELEARQHQDNRAEADRWFRTRVNDITYMIGANANPDDILEEMGKVQIEIARHKQTGVFLDQDEIAINNAMNGRLAKAVVFRDIVGPENNAASRQGILRMRQAAKAISARNYVVDIPGRGKINVAELLDPEQSARLATSLTQAAEHNAGVIRYQEDIRERFIYDTYLKQITEATLNRDRFDADEMAQAISVLETPGEVNIVKSLMATANSFIESENRNLADLVRDNTSLFLLGETIRSAPENVKSFVLGEGQSFSSFANMVENLDTPVRPAVLNAANEKLRFMMSGTKPTAAEVKVDHKITALNAMIQSATSMCEPGDTVCLLSNANIAYDNPTKEERAVISRSIDPEHDWFNPDERFMNIQRIEKLASMGIVTDNLGWMLKSALNDTFMTGKEGDLAPLAMQYWAVLQDNDNMKPRLASQLEENTAAADSYVYRNAPVGGSTNPVIRQKALDISNGMPVDVVPSAYTARLNQAFATLNDDLPDSVKTLIEGNENEIRAGLLPVDRFMLDAIKAKAIEIAPRYGVDGIEDAISEAYGFVTQNVYTKSRYAWNINSGIIASRPDFYKTLWFEGAAPHAWVPKEDSIEAKYPPFDNDNPERFYDLVDETMITEARKINPDIEWERGINLWLTPATRSISGEGQHYYLVTVDRDNQFVFLGSDLSRNTPTLTFDELYQSELKRVQEERAADKDKHIRDTILENQRRIENRYGKSRGNVFGPFLTEPD